ncbi:MAG: alpha/beta hydrolase-fold protein [Acidimicrobiales bacterium]
MQPPYLPSTPSSHSTGWGGTADVLMAVVLLGAVAVAGALALSGALDAVRVDRGPVQHAVVAVAVAGALASVVGRPLRWWRTWGIGMAAGATAVVAGAAIWIHVAGLSGGASYPLEFLVYGWVAIFVLGAGLSGLKSGPLALRTGRALAGPAAVLAAFLLINGFYGYWPTAGALLDHPLKGQVSRSKLAAGLHGRAPLPPIGEFGPVDIPGTSIGFKAATSYLWIPPDFARVPHADLPVVVTLTGIPGRAKDWAVAGGAVAASAAWAPAHHGRAPVVLMVDQNGLPNHDTECLNSREGPAFSYLTEVIPWYIMHKLGIHHDPKRWGLVGFSEGGTCSLTLALTDHGIFGRFMDISGDAAPDFGTQGRLTLQVLYGGSRAAMRAHDPSLLMRHHRYPHLEAWFAVGLQDRGNHLIEPILAREAARAGMHVHTWWAPGHHTWVFARTAFQHLYPGFASALTSGA